MSDNDSDINDILVEKYTLHIRFPDGHEVKKENIMLLHVRHQKVYDTEHGGRPAFLQITPEVNDELWDYIGLRWRLHPRHGEGVKNGD